MTLDLKEQTLNWFTKMPVQINLKQKNTNRNSKKYLILIKLSQEFQFSIDKSLSN